MVHDTQPGPDLVEGLCSPDIAVLDTLANEIEAQVTGVSKEKIPFYLKELKAILWDHYRPVRDMFPTIRVVRSKHVKDLVRENPGVYPHLAALSDFQLLRVISMLLGQEHPHLNKINRDKFVVEEGLS